MTPNTQADAPDLESRYGRTPQKARRDRVIGWSAAIAFVLIFTAWVVWVAFDGTSATIDSRDLGHEIIDDQTASVSYEVSMAPGLRASCALQVQNEAHAIVGWKIVDIPESESFTRAFTDEVRTTELGVTGLIYSCWLP